MPNILTQDILDILDSLERCVDLVKSQFVARDEIIELMAACAVAQEHLLIVGPPGTAKSELVRQFALRCSAPSASSPSGNGHTIPYFEYLLTRFTEPNEIFGPVNLSAIQSGDGDWRNTGSMLPRAEFVFLDEVFKGNSAILNALLTILNERVFYNGKRRDIVPLICAVGATNNVQDDIELAALFDRFLLRAWVENIEESLFPELFRRGWLLEQRRIDGLGDESLVNVVTTGELRQLHTALSGVDLQPVAAAYREVVRQIRADGIQLSDRRAVKLLKLIAASALRHRRQAANPGDFWILRHVWHNPEQIPHLQAIVDPYVTAFAGETWSAERSLALIEPDVEALDARSARVATDAEFASYLRDVEERRRELIRHSASTPDAADADQAKCREMLDRLNQMIENIMSQLETQL